MNLTTGESRMLGGVKGTTGANTETGDDGRVKALFVPSDDNSE